MSSYIDLILGIFLIYSAYRGYKAGFLFSFSRFLFVLGILLSLFVGLKAKGLIYPGLIASPYIAIVILALILTILIRFLIKKGVAYAYTFFKQWDVVWLDPVLGILLGIIKAYLIVYIVVSIIAAFNYRPIMTPIIKSSLAPHMYNQVRIITGINLMQYLKELSIKKTVQDVKEGVNNTVKQIEKPPAA